MQEKSTGIKLSTYISYWRSSISLVWFHNYKHTVTLQQCWNCCTDREKHRLSFLLSSVQTQQQLCEAGLEQPAMLPMPKGTWLQRRGAIASSHFLCKISSTKGRNHVLLFIKKRLLSSLFFPAPSKHFEGPSRNVF